MRRRTLIVLFALGTAGGYASGIASLYHRPPCHSHWGAAPSPPQAPPAGPEGAPPAQPR
ncbi:hypothetical protein POL68_12960 [Stigmatella sp. ncwal1]|uniref:Uncharacterized protein n=1 Tax=Stigmatella ashevillensis TaxID=2995309 RepID=A0ABT5D6U5_9BACT|nr:hypothetical protein [Stigmatella ashevillena]MDC0709376.1 hypothetical protein [Stigmatella ashevillena]